MKTANLLQLCIVAASFALPLQLSAQEWTDLHASEGCIPNAVDARAEDYRSWIKPYAEPSREDTARHKQEVEIFLTVLDGDNLVPDRSRTWVCGDYCCQMRTTYSVSSSGMVSMQRVTPMAVQGGGPDRLPAEKSQTMQRLIRDLLQHPPDDHAILPPAGRRLVVRAQAGNKAIARVYDRADIPAPVLEVLGLIGAVSGPIWMEFQPTLRAQQQLAEPPIAVDAVGIRVLHQRDPATNGLRPDTVTLAISRDRSMIVTHYFSINDRTVVTDRSGARIFLTVSDYTVDRRWISISHAFFTPDSRYLLLLSNLPAIYIYDTNTWKSVDTLPGLPAGASAFYPASDWKHGVVVLRSGEVEAWDISKGQKLSELDLQGNLQEVSFSEDDSRFAVSSIRLNQDSSSTFHLRVWDTNTGKFVREMIPPYYFENDEISRPMWWGHGKYLLADIRTVHWGGYMVAIWNVESGHLRGGFPGCDHSEDPYAVGIEGPRLLKWCRDNTLLVWDIPTAVEKVTEFEQSLGRTR